MSLVLLLFAAIGICWALSKPSQPRRERRRPAPPTPDEDVWFILSQL